MTITGGSALPKDEIDRMMKDAEQFANEDKQRRDLAEARNLADNLVYQTEKTLKEQSEKLAEADRTAVEAAVQELKDSLATEDLDKIRSASEKLTEASHKLAEHMYAHEQQGTGDAGAGAEGGAASSDDDVVDAEIVEEAGA